MALRCRDGVIAELGHELPAQPGETVLDGRGALVTPGLHDHHCHVLATAAALRSVDCSPAAVGDADGLAAVLRSAPGTGWLRGVGYHERVAGDLDARVLDRLAPHRPVRLQHRSGAMWFMNTAALEAIGALAAPEHLPAGVLRDETGRPNGCLFRVDRWLRDRLGASDPVDLAPLSRAFAASGVTGVTDATPTNDDGTVQQFVGWQREGAWRQRTRLMGGDALTEGSGMVTVGERKLLLDDSTLPAFDDAVALVQRAHVQGRGVAIHCVTRLQLVFALSALEAAGPPPGGALHRIEHASVVAEELMPMLKDAGVTVVTQPEFVLSRGDSYLAEVPRDELPGLYRLRSLMEAGIPLGAGSDAPYGALDPQAAIRAATDRRTASGQALGVTEAVAASTALGWYLSPPEEPGGGPRRLAVGAPADLCLWRDAAPAAPRSAASVRATVVAGVIVHGAGLHAP